MELEITPTDHPPRELLLSADESPASVDDYAGRGTCYVARSDGRLVGEYVLLHTRPFTAEIVNLAVASAYRRRGIGTALLAHAVATARKAGFRILEIGTGDTSWGLSPFTSAADSSAAASNATISASTTRNPSSNTGSNAAT